MKQEILRMEHICVREAAVHSLRSFHLNLFRGELMTVFDFSVNGAGDLAQVLRGRLELERGRILLDGVEMDRQRLMQGERYGLFIVGNTANLHPDWPVAEQLFFGSRPLLSHVVPPQIQLQQSKKLLEQFDISMDPRQKCRSLALYQELLLCLLRAYAKQARVIVLNDLPDLIYLKGGGEVLQLIARLKRQGIAFLWINHRMKGIRPLVDGVIVVHNGKNIRTIYHQSWSVGELTRMAEGGSRPALGRRPRDSSAPPVFCFRHIGTEALRDLSMEIPARRVVGVWANEPLVLHQFRAVLCGEQTNYQGEMSLCGSPYRPACYEQAVKRGVQYVDFMHRERHAVDGMSVADNLLLQQYWLQNRWLRPVSKGWKRSLEHNLTRKYGVDRFGSWGALTDEQQILLLCQRCLLQAGKLYVFTELLAGLNGEMMQAVDSVLEEMLEHGQTVLLTSMNLSDLAPVCDEIQLILGGGRVIRIPRAQFPALQSRWQTIQSWPEGDS